MRVDVIRRVPGDDDAVGGAQSTGSVIHESVPAAISAISPTQRSLEQGLEVEAMFNFTVRSHNVSLIEKDEIRVVFPTWHEYYNQTFRIRGVRPPRGRRRYAPQHAVLSRIRESRRSSW